MAFALSLLLGVAHFFGGRVAIRQKAAREKALSFVAGVSVAYVFLILMPELYKGVNHLDQLIFVLALLGFVLVHLSEKYLYQHLQGAAQQFRHQEIHFLVLLTYYFLIGVILFHLFSLRALEGWLFYVPLLFYAATGRVIFVAVKSHWLAQRVFQLLVSAAPAVGVLAAPWVGGDTILYHSLLAFVVGSFLYIALLDFIPHGKKGRPFYFTLGACIYLLLIAASWIVV